jgi:A/G-specific adenine glycosylase
MQFYKPLLKWYKLNMRDLPWRNNPKPYPVWLSEIILQQTRVNQGISYYYRFLTAFPSVMALHKAPEQAVLKLWQGLGYYSRARNLKKAAGIIALEWGGTLPSDYNTWLRLPGVGDYTAAAISSICFNEKVPVLDGNVHRVMSRLTASELPIETQASKQNFKKILLENMKGNHGEFNQAMMELGALVCTPKSPLCSQCPLKDYCLALKNGNPEKYPIKKKKGNSKFRFMEYVLMEIGGKIIIHERNAKDIWNGLYELPLVESKNQLQWNDAVSLIMKKYKLNKKANFVGNPIEIKHILSHQKLNIRFWHVKVREAQIPENYISVHKGKISSYPFPKPIADYLKQKGL